MNANTTSPQVSAASPNVNAASPQVSTASVSDNTVYAFMVKIQWIRMFLTTSTYSKFMKMIGKKIQFPTNIALMAFSDSEKFDKASKDLDHLLGSQITDKSKKGLGYSAVPLPHPLIYNKPKKLNLSYSGLDEFKEPEFKGYGPKDSEQESNVVCDKKKSDNSKENSEESLVEAQVSQDISSFVETSPNVDKETVFLVNKKVEFTKPKNHEKPVKKLVRPRAVIAARSYTRQVSVVRVNGVNDIKTSGKPQQDDKGFVDSGCSSFDMKNIVPKESLTCLIAKATLDESMLWHRRLGHINFKNINKLVKDNLVRGLPTKHFENDQTCVACLKGKQHRASFLMHKKYCLVVTDDYSRFTWVFFLTTKDETSEILKNFIKEIENLVDKKVKIIRSDNGTEFKNKVLDDFCREKGTQGELNAGTSEENSQDCIVMPIWKNASYFNSPTQDVDNGKPKSAADDQKQDGDGLDNENDAKDKSDDDSSPKEVNVTGQHVNTTSPDVNTGSFKLNDIGPSVNTASSYDKDSPKDMFTMGASHTLEATYVEFFSDEDEPEVDLGNITNSYTVLNTPNTRIHKDHLIKNVIGDVKSTVQTRRMTKPTSKQGFLNAVYDQKTHDTLNTCFLSQTEPTSIAKALSDSSWVDAMQEELLQFKL
ncbi:putative ribonuclease H-like domain-containing protein [Tanacetum coccineum]